MHLPEFRGGDWLNSKPLSRADLEGRVVLVDFWDYTCVNCIRTLPHIREWHRKYNDKGLTIIGVHTPEFLFTRETANVARAARSFGLEYPIVLDNDYAIWNAFGNRYWPAKYFFDHRLQLRNSHFGEGAYLENEVGIQALLRERDSSVELPPVEQMLAAPDEGAFCMPTTPELYLGWARGIFGNGNAAVQGKPSAFKLPEKMAPDMVYLDGEFIVDQWSVSAPKVNRQMAKLLLNYEALEANIVLYPPEDGPGMLELRQDGMPLKPELAPEAVSETGRTILRVDVPRMYKLVRNPRVERHALELVWLDAGIEAFAFTFTGCG
jgi:thiol-disulfide isomerase/thioredoxin